MSWAEIMTSSTLYQNTFILRRPRVAGFADIIKIATMFKVKKFKKKIEIMYKMQSMSVFLYITKVADFRWKMLMTAEFKGCVTQFIYFFDLL